MLLLLEDQELEALGDTAVERAYEEAGGRLVRYPISSSLTEFVHRSGQARDLFVDDEEMRRDTHVAAAR
jgi:hypothetical protein